MGIESRDPGTEELIEDFEPFDKKRIEAALADAARRYRDWRLTSFNERAKLLFRAADLLDAGKEKYAEIASREMGKTIAEARAEIDKCTWVCRHYADHGEAYLKRQPIEAGKRASYVDFQPIGPVLAVMPWNFPFWQVFRFAAPAVMAGNVALLKHASNVPQSALAIEEVFKEAGFPEHVFQTLLIGSGPVKDIIADDRIAAVTLTGSNDAGSRVAAQAGAAIKKSVMELGGSDPFIVMPSADFDAALSTGVKARMMNNGQSCIAAKRFLVHADIYDRFLDAYVAETEALKVGYQLDDGVQVGPLALKDIRDGLAQQVKKTVAEGGRVLAGGHELPRKGYYFAPTVLVDVRKNSPAYYEEMFGPVAIFFKVGDIDEAIAIANDTPFGLGASAWTTDDREQQRFIRDLEAGAVFINLQVASDPRLPFGGIKRSGFGRELDGYGIREFVDIKTVAIG